MDEYLLDTNAYFKILAGLLPSRQDGADLAPADANLALIKSHPCHISRLTQIEIVSVIGQYARGGPKQAQVCHRRVRNAAGDLCACSQSFYEPARKRWNARLTGQWLKLVKDISEGNSPVLTVSVLPVSEPVLREAEQFISHSLKHNFHSMDAVIAATAIHHGLTLVTADRGLKAGLTAISHPFISL